MKRLRRLVPWLLIALFLLPSAALAQGQAHVPPVSGEPSQKHEFRAVWVASVTNIDWPSKTGLSADAQKAELIKILDDLKAWGMNAVVLQVRPTDDTFYRSNINPWSKYLTGVAGKDPGYDPLAFAVEEAHKRNLELHAWFNPYRVAMDTKRENLPAGSWAKAHPEYVVAHASRLIYDPGIPEAKQHIIDSVMEVVQNYDIDGVHFDDYFYPDAKFPDDATFAQYGAGYTNKDDWRRENVNGLIRDLADEIKAAKPYVQFGVSPFGIWRNKSASVPEGSDTRGNESYAAMMADTRRWVKEGWLDYIAPQIYWSIGFTVADYQKLVTWWADVVDGTKTKLYVGHADYKVNANTDRNWLVPGEIKKQIELNRSIPQVAGSIHFSMKDLRRNALGVLDDVKEAYQHPALIGSMEWLPGTAPEAPVQLKARRTKDGVELTWEDAGDSTAYYVVYRAPLLEEIDLNDGRYIVATLRRTGGEERFEDTGLDGHTVYRYLVTAVDRLHHESEPSKVTIQAK